MSLRSFFLGYDFMCPSYNQCEFMTLEFEKARVLFETAIMSQYLCIASDPNQTTSYARRGWHLRPEFIARANVYPKVRASSAG